METYKEKILKESYGYKGHYFWENYMLSNLVRTVSKDLKAYGDPNVVLDMYTSLYGDETKPLFETMIENEEALHEAAKIKGTLLFEGVGEKNIEKYLNEVHILPIGAGSLGIGALLKTLWSKLKFLGGGMLANVGSFLKSGFGWAAELIKNGAAWVAKTPIINVAVPMLLVTGGLKAAKALVNKLRRKAGKKPMTPEENKQFEEIANKNKNKIEKTREKVLKKAS